MIISSIFITVISLQELSVGVLNAPSPDIPACTPGWTGNEDGNDDHYDDDVILMMTGISNGSGTH